MNFSQKWLQYALLRVDQTQAFWQYSQTAITVMVSNNEKETMNGTVDEALPNTLFKVTLQNGEQILTFLSGKMRKYRIRVLIGDKVVVEIDQYGGKGRITKRL